jgi:SAM-dependent MidA family methyltransferase
MLLQDSAEQAILAALTERLRRAILAAHSCGEPGITTAAYMAATLYDSENGYYARPVIRTGRSGDFLTSVSTGPLFGRLLAHQISEIWDRLGRPEEFSLVEQGAHEGGLAAAILHALFLHDPACAAAATYRIIEPYEQWRQMQATALAPLIQSGAHIEWAANEVEIPPFTGLFLCNELADAFPVHRLFRTAEDTWAEWYIDWDSLGARFVWRPGPVSTQVASWIGTRLPSGLPVGWEGECAPALVPWLQTILHRCERGGILVIDYGQVRDRLYHPERTAGTWKALRAHRFESDPLALPGLCDLTAHVDFTLLAETATAAGAEVAGFTDQGRFLISLASRCFSDSAPPTPSERRQLQTLSHPELMGRAFKVLLLTKLLPEPFAGFSLGADLRATL